jgi:hypothetical protein
MHETSDVGQQTCYHQLYFTKMVDCRHLALNYKVDIDCRRQIVSSVLHILCSVKQEEDLQVAVTDIMSEFLNLLQVQIVLDADWSTHKGNQSKR